MADALTQNSYTRVTLALDIVRAVTEGQYTGYHELGVIKHQIDLHDTITVEESRVDSVECDDAAVPCDGRNLCLKTVGLVREKFNIDSCVRITIRKRIPVQAGLAGGSADAAATLSLLNRLWGLGLAVPELCDLGRAAGMDVPYYFVGNTAFDSEAGLRLEPVATRCSFVFVLACPDFGVSTSEAYGGIDYASVGRQQMLTRRLRTALEKNDRKGTVRLLHNDFEDPVFRMFPRLLSIRQELLDAGCSAALLTGSGSTVIGCARDIRHAEDVRRKIGCRTIVSSTLST